jgi:Phytoene dehydrogenase and related proteins
VSNYDYDAIVIGSGPNGLSAAITMQQAGLSVLVLEAKSSIGGGTRSEELTLPGFIHDVCSAVHPLGIASPFFSKLPLDKFGLEFISPPIAAAHPFDDGTSAILTQSIQETASQFKEDESFYIDLMQPLVDNWKNIENDLLGPIHLPQYPLKMAQFGIRAITSANSFSKNFKSEKAKGLWGGMAAHSMQPLSNLTTSAIALVLMINGHLKGWPIVKGGSGNLATALANYFQSLNGKIENNINVQSLQQLPSAKALLFDVTPKQLLKIAGNEFSALYKWQLQRYKYGMGVFKIDWAMDSPIPFTSELCRNAGTIHLGNSFKEIAEAESLTAKGKYTEKPFVLLAQQSLFDSSRAPEGKHTAWAYCHVPNGSEKDMTLEIENQVERFAPGFKERIIAKHVMNTSQMEAYNFNYIGGDINGGVIDITQLFTRPVLRLSPYRTSNDKIYICSSSTPPGGGVHGMCGYNAAKRALKDVFHISI